MANGVKKIRITGGEPLVRKYIMSFFQMLTPHLKNGDLDEVTLTTNGTLLDKYAKDLFAAGVRRVNISLDTLNPERYKAVTRIGDLKKVISGIEAALDAGLKVKLNAVAMRGDFEDELDGLIKFAHSRGMDLTLIEEMPLGIDGFDRKNTHLPLGEARKKIEEKYKLTPVANIKNPAIAGPAKYVTLEESGGRIGFITPMSCDFCSSCNRVRISCTGKLFTCMGQEGSVDLLEGLRNQASDAQIESLIKATVMNKPEGHDFAVSKDGVKGIKRNMNELGG
jgi:cyclic pyranopterin phosphate synthase